MTLLKGTDTQDIILKLYQEKGIECYVADYFSGRWNQDKDMEPGSVLSRMG